SAPGGGDAVDPITGRIGDPTLTWTHRASGLPCRVSKVLPPFLVELVSGTVGVEPSASLRLGPAGRGPCAAASQMCLPISLALPWAAVTFLITSGGTPPVVEFSFRPSIILVWDVRQALNSLQTSSGPAFFWPAACNAAPCFWVSSRMARSCWQAGGGPCCGGGAPNGDAIPGPPIPGDPGIPGMPPNCAAAGLSGTTASTSRSGTTRLGLMASPLRFDSPPQGDLMPLC